MDPYVGIVMNMAIYNGNVQLGVTSEWAQEMGEIEEGVHMGIYGVEGVIVNLTNSIYLVSLALAGAITFLGKASFMETHSNTTVRRSL